MWGSLCYGSIRSRAMGRLAEAFLDAAGQREGADALRPSLSASDAAMLEALLSSLTARGAAAHLDIRLDGALFATHLGRCGAPIDSTAATGIHAEDLFLAAAALFGDATA